MRGKLKARASVMLNGWVVDKVDAAEDYQTAYVHDGETGERGELPIRKQDVGTLARLVGREVWVRITLYDRDPDEAESV